MGAVAVEVLDVLCGALVGGDVGEDKAVAEAVAQLAVEAELELLGVDRAPPARARRGKLRAREAHPADDEPQRLALPARGRVAGLGDLGAVHPLRLLPSGVGDPRERAPHRRGARQRHREARALGAQSLEQLKRVVGGINPEGRLAVAGGQ